MSGGGSSSDGRRVKGVIHWVSAQDAVEAEIRLFNPLFTKENPDDVEEGQTWEDNLNPESMVKITGYLEPSLRETPIGQAVQFERVGYFCPDTDSTPEHLVFNRTVTLKGLLGQDQQVGSDGRPHSRRRRRFSENLRLLYAIPGSGQRVFPGLPGSTVPPQRKKVARLPPRLMDPAGIPARRLLECPQGPLHQRVGGIRKNGISRQEKRRFQNPGWASRGIRGEMHGKGQKRRQRTVGPEPVERLA